MSTLLARALLVTAALASGAAAAPLSEAERACVAALNEAGVSVAQAQAGVTNACLVSASPDAVTGCVTDGAAPELVAAVQASFDAAVASCQELPPFGVAPTVDEGVATAAVTHLRGLFGDAFATSPGGALVFETSDRRGRRCQAGVAQGANAVATVMLDGFARCTRRVLARGAEGPDALAECVLAAAKGPTKRVRKRLVSRARRRCRGVDAAAAFAGPCGGGSARDAGRCLGARAVCRACRVANAMDALEADCDLVDDGADNDSCTFRVGLSGDAIPFDLGPDGRIEDADVSLLEHPDRHVITGPDGHFAFDGLEEGSEVTVTLAHPDYHAIQTGTIRLGPAGVERVTFQAVTHQIYELLGDFLGVEPDEANRCQMVTTVTRVGKSIYDPGAHGEAGVTVTLDPPLPAEHGPIYFNSSVLPDRSLTATSDDGGVLFIQVPPGEYVWTAHKAGAVFSRIKMKCRAGILVNASPPKGLQRH
jgi:hypothetical protein